MFRRRVSLPGPAFTAGFLHWISDPDAYRFKDVVSSVLFAYILQIVAFVAVVAYGPGK